MELNKAAHVIEAILFVSGGPAAIPDIAAALDMSELEVMSAARLLENEYEAGERGIKLMRYGDSLQLVTRKEFAPFVERLLQPVQRQTLSQAAMETLAVIAYRQPATRGDVEQVRGVKCDYSVQSLLEKGLIKEVGRKDTPGRPILYATTDGFLKHFGISDVRELPPPPENAPSDAQPLTP